MNYNDYNECFGIYYIILAHKHKYIYIYNIKQSSKYINNDIKSWVIKKCIKGYSK